MSSSKSSSGSWWSALGFGKAAASAPDTDYADMGTAFGLDASLGALPMPEPRGEARNRAPAAPSRPARKP